MLPVQQAQANNLIQMLANGGPGGGPTAAPGGPPADPQSAQVGSAFQALDGANPQGMSDLLQSMSNDLAKVYLTSATRVPNAAPHVAKARESLTKAIQEITKAAQVVNAVRPIANNAGVGPGVIPQGVQPDISALLG